MRRPPPVSHFPRYPISAGTILLAIGVTAAWQMKGVDVSALMANGEIGRGQLWRLLTDVLPHVNVLHLAFNAYWTWVFGTMIETVFGHIKTFGIFCLLAVVSSGFEYGFLQGGVGLSGVGYGLFGLLWVLSSRDRRFADAVDKNTVWTFVGWFFFCIALTFAGTPIGNIAHGVGAAMGALLGFTICAARTKRIVLTTANCAMVALAVAAATLGRPYINFSHTDFDESRFGYDALMAGKNDEAVRWLEYATRLNPNDSSGWFNLGLAYGRIDEPDKSHAAYQRASQLDPSNAVYKAAAKSDR